MSFDFFNTSHLAFGSKLTQAFTELEKQLSFAEDAMARLKDYISVVDLYTNRNYRAPVPSSPTSPVRTNELFDVFNDKSCYLKDLYFDTSDNTIRVDLLLYDQTNNLFTAAKGSSDIKEGYCYVRKSMSNNYPNQELTFSKTQDATKGTLLFQYRIDTRNQVNIKNVNSIMLISAADDCEYKTISRGENITFPYTAKDYECICAIGEWHNFWCDLNGKRICQGQGWISLRCIFLYLKPGDVVKGPARGFKINYNK